MHEHDRRAAARAPIRHAVTVQRQLLELEFLAGETPGLPGRSWFGGFGHVRDPESPPAASSLLLSSLTDRRPVTLHDPWPPPRPPAFRGRLSERELLDRLLDNVRGGQSAVLVIRGEAGVGKTALLRYCARQASGFQIEQIAGVESEMELPFAGLHQLCSPMLDRLDALPEPQQLALRSRSASSPARLLASWSGLPRSACWRRSPSSGR